MFFRLQFYSQASVPFYMCFFCKKQISSSTGGSQKLLSLLIALSFRVTSSSALVEKYGYFFLDNFCFFCPKRFITFSFENLITFWSKIMSPPRRYVGRGLSLSSLKFQYLLKLSARTSHIKIEGALNGP